MAVWIYAAHPLAADTVAYWRFDGDGVTAPSAGSSIAHTSDRTTYPATGGILAIDVSGNGNHLHGWNGNNNGLDYSSAVPSSWTGTVTNEFSVQNDGSAPRAHTWATQSSPSGVNLDTWQPLQWTIEASVYLDPSAASGWRTFVGRDGYDVSSGAGRTGAACLYFQKSGSTGALKLTFSDAAGNEHHAEDGESLLTGRWYHVAATSDGSTLSLYKWDTTMDAGYSLVSQVDISGSADPRLAADTIDSTSLPLDSAGDPMNWTVGSGTWDNGGSPESGQVDYWIGMIDEVRISNQALNPNELLFANPLMITDVGLAAGGGGADQLWLQWNSVAGAYYRVTAKSNLLDETWVPQAVGIAATPPVNLWTSGVLTAESSFYRVETEVAPLVLDLDPNTVLNDIDENVYGHFLEHIFHSANGGLWGDLVWNRSFETLPPGTGSWSTNATELIQSSLDTNVRLPFGDTAWTDYEFTLEAYKDGGDEGFLIMFRANGDQFYWLNLGGWGNTRHQLEKGQGNAVGPQYAGSINTGQWYGIRIRCEGNHIQCWLDDGFGEVLIIDWTDTSSPSLSGQVGVGTWVTQARFRNILVETLGGSPLWSGLPDPNALTMPNWETYGSATLQLSSDALNSYQSVAIGKSSSSEGGLSQTPFRFDVQPYTGSLWAKGNSITGMVVRLKDGITVLAETNFPALGGTWQNYPFLLTPSTMASNATLEISLLGSGTAYLDQVSLMGQDAIDTGGYRPDLLTLVSNIAPPVIRWPGGCFASAYRWKDGIGAQHDRVAHPVLQWDDRDVNSFGTDEFIQMCHLIGAEPILVLNIGVLNPCAASDRIGPFPSEAELLQDSLDWIEYCNGDTNTTWGAVRAANGHPEPYNVKYWEIDNETWSMGSTWYANKVNEYAPLMRAADPSIKLIAVGSGWADQSWSQDIIDQCATNIDYISVHSYLGPEEYATGPLAYENYLIDLANYIAGSDNPDMEIYNSEWNAQSIDLRTGLFAGGLLNAFERQGAVFTMGGPALMYRHLSAGAWNNSFMNFDHTGSFVAPNYVVMKLWRDHYAPLRIQADGDAGSLNLVATKTNDGSKVNIKVVNPSTTEKRTYLNLPGGTIITSADFQYVTAPSLFTENSLAEPNAVQAVTGTTSVAGSTVEVTFPPESASVVSISLQ